MHERSMCCTVVTFLLQSYSDYFLGVSNPDLNLSTVLNARTGNAKGPEQLAPKNVMDTGEIKVKCRLQAFFMYLIVWQYIFTI